MRPNPGDGPQMIVAEREMDEMDGTPDGDTATDRTLLLVDDDLPFLNRLGRAMEERGFSVRTAPTIAEAVALATDLAPAYAVLDMRLDDGNGLDVVPVLRNLRDDMRIIMLTGYGNIATAVAAVKAGAVDYLAKPTDADAVEAALWRAPGPSRRRPNVQCRPTVCVGSISNAFMSCATATFRKRRAASICTAARCSEFLPSAHRNNGPGPGRLARISCPL